MMVRDMTDSEQLAHRIELARAAGRPITCRRCGTALTWLQLQRHNSFCSLPCAKKAHKRPALDRLLEKLTVHEATGCWLWHGRINNQGYGHIWNGRGAVVMAHRLSYELHVGPIPDGLTLDHLCRTPRCVNPAHLEPVTMRENIMRGMSVPAQNARKTHCKRGHPFDEENTYYWSTQRLCRTCKRERDSRLRNAAKEPNPLELVR